ncbi:MAG: ATP-dependent helicase [Candidatus Marinimicrobia bacterium]|nr:ATP-dependent helicase [Candidatus Neomarinimicrobiota bacterium]
METMISLRSKLEALPPSGFAVEILEKSGLHALYKDKDDPELQERRRNQEEFINSVKMFENFNPEAGIEDFLQDVSLQTDIDQWEDSAEAVTLMTIHSAKGLEFRRVFIAGMEEGLFPLERARMDKRELEEERRLFYVALTRAMEKVTITSARQRMQYGQLRGARSSEFIEEIPQKYLQKDKTHRQKRYDIHTGRSKTLNRISPAPAEGQIILEQEDNKPIQRPRRVPLPWEIV